MNQRSPPHQNTQSRFPVPGIEVPITSGFENQKVWLLNETEGSGSTSQILLKGLCTDLLGLTLSEF